jgi:anti-sigma factor RsiW
MNDGYACLDAHAYVDNSLNPEERLAFEAAMRRDAALRARVEAWEAQNEAIRLAFGATPRPRHAPPLGRPSNENAAAPCAAPATGERPRPLRGRPLRVSPRPRWRAATLFGLIVIGALVSFAGGPDDPRRALMRRADSILRSVAEARPDFVSDDPRAVAAWLGERFARVDPERLAPPGWSLIGARIVAGLDSAAALVLYEDALGGRAGLLLTPTDALPALPPVASSDADETILAGAARGFAYVAIGPTRSGIGALIPAATGGQPPP